MNPHARRARAARRKRTALLLAAVAPQLIGQGRANAAPAHIYDSKVTGNYNNAATWTPAGVPVVDAVLGANFGDVAIIHGGTNVVTINSDVGASQVYVGSSLDYGGPNIPGNRIVHQT